MAVHRVFGPDSTGYPLDVLHTTAAYAAADTDTDDLAQTIHRVRPGHALFTVSRIIVNEVHWQRVPIGGGPARLADLLETPSPPSRLRRSHWLGGVRSGAARDEIIQL
ncbi:hypothetical protein P3T27_007268 [Kitasatospora sp. MAA19]|uniref:hypothetical protein n=1 Tax=Kitasatospora sp. MAA19 TaxID=3035090 RepID=UPI0024754D1B|nr:hypothetical protein [Kitasatospora sp. MAA19]MDH6710518.1 hypothetical protein [Kitasatospora sp. MAA19]